MRALLQALTVILLLQGAPAVAMKLTAGCQIKQCVDSVPCPGQSSTDQCLPSGATIRGLSLSGCAKMKQVDGPGKATWQKKRLVWLKRYQLEQGCALLHAQRPVLVDIAQATAFIDSGTSAVVHTEGAATRFVNLTDRHRGGMTVVFGKHYVDLAPGFELVLVRTEGGNIREIAIHESIGWRDLEQIESENLAVFLFRISAADMMEKCKIYRQLHESNLESDQALKEELLKGVAALETMHNRKKGPFKLDPFKYGPVQNQQTATKGQPT